MIILYKQSFTWPFQLKEYISSELLAQLYSTTDQVRHYLIQHVLIYVIWLETKHCKTLTVVVSDSGVELEVSDWVKVCVECSEIWSIKCHIVCVPMPLCMYSHNALPELTELLILYLSRSKSKSLQNYSSRSKPTPILPCRQACKASTPSLATFPSSPRTKTSSTDIATGVAPFPFVSLIPWLDNINSFCPGDWIHLVIKMKCRQMKRHQAT